MAGRYYKYFVTVFDAPLLITPIARVHTYGLVGQRLTTDNAKGFLTRRYHGQLKMCASGYHLFNGRGLRENLRVGDSEAGGPRRWYVVEPIGPVTIGYNLYHRDKVIVRQYRIVRPLKAWEMRRALGDSRRSHKAKRP
jgi:hypothetical protein